MQRSRLTALAAIATIVAIGLAGCGSDTDRSSDTVAATTTSGPGDEQRFPDIVDATAERAADGTWTFRVTVSSPYDTPERYADGWRVLAPDTSVLGEHGLAHDHANEQPFTRTQRGVTIPDGITDVTIEGRDQRYGYGGTTLTVTLTAD